MPKIVCTVCDGENFDNIDGFYYCNICGTKSQNVCDIELSDEEFTAAVQEITVEPKKQAKKEREDSDKNLETNFSTFEVLNYLLKRQCDDLIKLGVEPVIKDVVLKLWCKYLQKLQIAFIDNQAEEINSNNIKWKRDKFYFELYNLDLKHTEELTQQEAEENNDSEFDFKTFFSFNPNKDNFKQENIVQDDKMIVDEENENNDKDSDQESDPNNNQDLSEDELNNSNDLVTTKGRKTILLTKFEYVRMPHTIALLNLALLLMKSQVLISDLIRFIYNGKLSYFNIDDVLPDYMQFSCGEDSTMFNLSSAPKTDYLRYLTSKLGNYLDINEIELIQINKITNRYVIDLNLPNELNPIVDLLIDKVNPVDKLDLKISQYENLEAIALSYIYVSMFILFFYNDDYCYYNDKYNYLINNDKEQEKEIFDLNNWIHLMQNRLNSVKTDCFGCELENIRTVKDLKSLKYSNIKHRHKLKTKTYISQYRRKDLIDTLKAPLLLQHENKLDSIENDLNKLDLNASLLYIKQNTSEEDFSLSSIELYFNIEKLNLIGNKDFRSLKFRCFVKDVFEKEYLRGRYFIGLESTTIDWILDVFHQISQTRNFYKFYDYVKKLLNKIK